MSPLVTVICVCYNHEQFVIEALNSVINQTYNSIEIIIIDDGSIDGSTTKINEWLKNNPQVHFLSLKENIGYCKAFNKALADAKGEYIIDFATDDIMLPEKVEQQVNYFQTLNDSYGVIFTDADYIDQNGKYLRSHFDYLVQKKLITEIPEGDIYSKVLSTYFIPSPTMMSRAVVYEKLNGYDENLSYEDFDFWIRSSREYRYAYLPEKTMKIRRKTGSMSSRWYKKGDPQLHSTYLVCRKAIKLNRTNEDQSALLKRLNYELRQSVFSNNRFEAKLFFDLLKEFNQATLSNKILYNLSYLKLPLHFFRSLYHKIRYQSFN